MAAPIAALGVAPERGLGLTGLSQSAGAVSARLTDGSEVAVPLLFAADGAALYAQNCAACHGDKGSGGIGVPLAMADCSRLA